MTKRALISVSDKTGVTTFAAGLVANGFENLHWGTRTVLKKRGYRHLLLTTSLAFQKC